MAAEEFIRQQIAVHQQLDLIVMIVHQSEYADRAGCDVEIFLQLFGGAEGQAGRADLLGQLPGDELLMTGKGQEIISVALGIAQKEILADSDSQQLLDIEAALDGADGFMIDAGKGNIQPLEKIIDALLLRKAGVGRAAGVDGFIKL